MGAGASVLRRDMGPYTEREWLVRVPFRGICSFTVSRIPPIDITLLEPQESSSEVEHYDYDYDHIDDDSGIEHWLANDGRDMDLA